MFKIYLLLNLFSMFHQSGVNPLAVNDVDQYLEKRGFSTTEISGINHNMTPDNGIPLIFSSN